MLFNAEPIALMAGVVMTISDVVVNDAIKKRVCSLELALSAEVCQNIGTGRDADADAQVEAAWIEWSVWISIVSTVLQVVLCLFAGVLADHFGRRPIVIFAAVGSTLNTIFNWMWTVNAAWPVSLLVGAAVLRAAESWSIVSVSLFASAVDSCHGDIRRRSMRIGFVEFAYGMGAIAGYIIASLTYALALPLLTFPLRLACSLAMAPLSLLLVGKSEYQAAIEESDHHHREGHLIGSLSPLSALRTAVRPRDGHARRNLLLLLVADLAMMLIMSGEMGIRQQFAEFPPLSWTAASVQYYSAATTTIDALTLATGLPLFIGRWQWRATTIAIIGSVSRFLCSFLEAITFNSAMFIAAGVAGLLKYTGVVLFRTLASAQASDDEQASLFSLLSLAEIVAQLLGTLIYSSLLTATTHWQWKGLAFAVSSVFGLYPIGVSVLLHLRR